MKVPTRRPPHRVTIPEHWTPAQAEAVHDFLADVMQAVFEAYSVPLAEVAQRELACPHDPIAPLRQGDPAEPQDDDIPF
jgi:hypothetical protein